MAHNPIFGSDPAKPASSPAERGPEDGAVSGTARPGEWDLGELAAKFAEHGGGRVSPEISAELALQIVLNEIVEQACLATGASGAAIVLERGGEWVCRASTGRSAPQLGARLDTASGLSGACVKTRTVQRCDDTENDPGADIEACRILGIRSVIILPMLRNGELVGVFEAFSTLPSEFGERDERTMEALSRRVLNNLERASGAVSGGEMSAAESSKSTREVADGTAVFAAASSERSDRSSDGKQDPPDQPSPQVPHRGCFTARCEFHDAGAGRGSTGVCRLAHRAGGPSLGLAKKCAAWACAGRRLCAGGEGRTPVGWGCRNCRFACFGKPDCPGWYAALCTRERGSCRVHATGN